MMTIMMMITMMHAFMIHRQLLIVLLSFNILYSTDRKFTLY